MITTAPTNTRPSRRIGLSVISAAVAATALMAPAHAAAPQESHAPGASVRDVQRCDIGPVFIIGDSLMDPSRGGAGKYTTRAFNKIGLVSHTYGLNGMSTRAAVNERYNKGLGSKKAQRSPIWVVELGTNDRAPGFAQNVKKVMKLATKKREVYWVNTSRPRSWQEGPGGPVNRILKKTANTRTNMHIINYRRMIKHRPQLMTPGHVHLTTRGSKVLARFLTTPFIAQCPQP